MLQLGRSLHHAGAGPLCAAAESPPEHHLLRRLFPYNPPLFSPADSQQQLQNIPHSGGYAESINAYQQWKILCSWREQNGNGNEPAQRQAGTI